MNGTLSGLSFFTLCLLLQKFSEHGRRID
jgi:hypothetical protein